MGSAALYHLASRGIRAIGIERFEPGHDRGSSHGDSRAIRLGYSEHPSYVPLVRSAFSNWRDLERRSGETLLTVTGILEAGKPGSRMVAGSLEACEAHQLEHEVLGAAEIGHRFPAFHLPEDYKAIWQPEGGFLRPDAANAAHLRLARESGATIRTLTAVRVIEPGPGNVRLRLGDGVVEAGSVIVTTGPWIGDLVPVLRPHLSVTRQVLCWYQPRRPEVFAPGALPVFMIEGADDILYGFPDFDGQGFKCGSHFGSGAVAHADLARQDAGPGDAARTRRFLEAYMPSGAGRLLGMKTCMYTMTPDEDFVVDLMPGEPRIVIASPCSGHGYKFASVLGEALADLATDGRTLHDLGRFRLDRFGAAGH